MLNKNSHSRVQLPAEWRHGIFVVYDGDCPFCSNFVKFQKLQQAVGKVTLVNARAHPDLVSIFAAADLPLDDGMALLVDGDTYYGAECLSRLAMLSSRNDLFNRVNAMLFRSRHVSSFVYPFLRFGRRVTLKVLRINPL